MTYSPWGRSAEVVRAQAGAKADAVRIGLVLGSGLGELAADVEDAVSIPYAQLDGFPAGGVTGHAQRLTIGTLCGQPVAVFEGRAHLYEGTEPAAMRVPMRTLRELGAEQVLLTNAAGSLRPDVGIGRLMLLSDHVNLTGANPLVGPNDDEVGPRFFPMGDAYDPELRARLHMAARAEGVDLAEGVYLAVTGPSFETPAEIRAFRTLGADAVGMSTVHETIVARHCGLRVAAISAITNLAEGLSEEELTHEHTLASAKLAAGDLRRVVRRFLEDL
jgi:xanthosine phosphorylase